MIILPLLLFYIQDAAAVAGVVIAATAMGLSHASGSHIPDAVRN